MNDSLQWVKEKCRKEIVGMAILVMRIECVRMVCWVRFIWISVLMRHHMIFIT